MTNDQAQAPTATVTTPTEREIHIERVFDAPRDRVFAVYTDPELIPEWWGPRDTTTIVDEMDVRHRRQLALRHARRRRQRDRLPRRLPRGHPARADRADVRVGGRCRATSRSRPPTFEDLGDRTKVTTISIFHTTEERDGMLGSGMEGGLNETYARLDELLARLAG